MGNKFAQVADEGHKVTPLELFFDLVFVFALTQVTGYLALHLTPVGFAQGLVLLALIWWAWVAYAWFGTTVSLNEGLVRVLLFAAMGGMLIVAIGLPEAFEDMAGGYDGAITAATMVMVAYGTVRLLHLALYAVVGRGDPGLRGAVIRLGIPVAIAVALLIVGSTLPPGPRLALYIAAVALDYFGAIFAGGRGWKLSVGHFAERHGLVIIIALGESIVSIGVGVADLPLSTPIVVAALLGLAVTACLWWLYFDVTSVAAEHRLNTLSGVAQNKAARDAYSFGHLIMVGGIVLLALGMKKVSLSAGEYGGFGHSLKTLVAAALCVGAAQYLAGLVYFRYRMTQTWSVSRLLGAVACLALLPLALTIPSTITLLLLLAVLVTVVVFETVRQQGPDGARAVAVG